MGKEKKRKGIQIDLMLWSGGGKKIKKIEKKIMRMKELRARKRAFG